MHPNHMTRGWWLYRRLYKHRHWLTRISLFSRRNCLEMMQQWPFCRLLWGWPLTSKHNIEQEYCHLARSSQENWKMCAVLEIIHLSYLINSEKTTLKNHRHTISNFFFFVGFAPTSELECFHKTLVLIKCGVESFQHFSMIIIDLLPLLDMIGHPRHTSSARVVAVKSGKITRLTWRRDILAASWFELTLELQQ